MTPVYKRGWLMLLVVLIALFLVNAQGISKTGKKDGANTLKHAKDIKPATYHIRNVKSKKYLAFLPGTLVEPTASKKSSITQWKVLKYKSKMYSINHSHGSLNKCLSARWVGCVTQCRIKIFKLRLFSRY
jgi:hypothetical protein